MLKIDFDTKKDYTYDDWLDYFRRVPVDDLLDSQTSLKTAPVECYAAASRWIEIIRNPSKMDKLYSARLKARQEEQSIMDIAIGDDDEAFYEALIRENVTQLTTSNISQQEVARLTQNINVFRKELRDIRSRKPKKGTVLEQVLKKAAMPRKSPKRKPRITSKKAENPQKSAKVENKRAKPQSSDEASKNKPSKTHSKGSLATETVKVSSEKEKGNGSQPNAEN